MCYKLTLNSLSNQEQARTSHPLLPLSECQDARMRHGTQSYLYSCTTPPDSLFVPLVLKSVRF